MESQVSGPNEIQNPFCTPYSKAERITSSLPQSYLAYRKKKQASKWMPSAMIYF